MKIKWRCGNDWHDDEDFFAVLAYSEEEAAELFAEEHDAASSEYPREQIVIVVSPLGRRMRFKVTGESTRVYRANKQDETPTT